MNTNKGNENNIVTNAFSRLVNYFKGVKSEWGKISWPERHQVLVETVFVIVIVFVFTLFIFGVDKIFEFILSKLH